LSEKSLGTFLDPIYSLLFNNEFSRASEKKNRSPTKTLWFKKPFIRGFTVKPKLAFFALTKKKAIFKTNF